MLCSEAPASARWLWPIHAAHQPGPVPEQERTESCCPGTSCWKTWLPRLQTHTPGASTNTARCQDCNKSSHALLRPPAQPGLGCPPAASPGCPGRAQLQAAAQPGSQPGSSSGHQASSPSRRGPEGAPVPSRRAQCSPADTASCSRALPAQPSQLHESRAGTAGMGMEAEHTASLKTELVKLMGGIV